MLADPEFIREGSTPSAASGRGRDRPARLRAVLGQAEVEPAHCRTASCTCASCSRLDRDTTLTLWADMFSRDLVGEVSVRSRPVDDPLLHELADPRRTRATIVDGLYIRLVNLPAALTSRSYSSAVDVVIEVTDDRLPANAGRWRLAAGGPADGVKPTCERTTAEPDLVMPVVALGAAYLGGTRLGGLADAGSHHRGTPGRAGGPVHSNVVGPGPLGPHLLLVQIGSNPAPESCR